MENFVEGDHPFQSAVENAKNKERGELIAKDPKHGGKVCEGINEYLDYLEGKNNPTINS